MKFFAVFAALLALAVGTPTTWTLQDLSEAIQHPETNPEYLPFLEHALNQMMEDIVAGNPVVPVTIIKPTITSWTLSELSAALENPDTNPALLPYLEAALNEMMVALHNGQEIESIPVVVPVSLEPVQAGTPVIAVPIPIAPAPELPTPVEPETPVDAETPVDDETPADTEVIATPAASSPLVQIVVNINQQ